MVPGTLTVAVTTGRAASLISIVPVISLPSATRSPSKSTRAGSPLKVPVADSAPRPLCELPLATDTSRLASAACNEKRAKSKRKSGPRLR